MSQNESHHAIDFIMKKVKDKMIALSRLNFIRLAIMVMRIEELLASSKLSLIEYELYRLH